MKLFSTKSKKTHFIPIVYKLGWWPHQHLMEVHAFEVEIIKSNLNLMNSKSIIHYTINGSFKKDAAGRQAFIKSVHHSEQLLNTAYELTNVGEKPITDAGIILTPIVGISDKKPNANADLSFEFTNQYEIESLHWGDNYIQFHCGNFCKEICLMQRK